MANTAIGEIGIQNDGQYYTLRPSFLAMQQLGTPEEIAETVELVISAKYRMLEGLPPVLNELYACEKVLHVCSDKSLPDLFGEPALVKQPNGLAVMQWVDGEDSHESLIGIAQALITAGIAGAPNADRVKRKASGDKKPFDPLEYIGVIIAHLGMSTDAAWQMTMIEFQRAFDAKFPPDEKEQNKMTQDEARQLLKRLGKI